MTVLVASNNAHKLEEIRPYLPGVRLESPTEAGLAFEYEETGGDFVSNALGKAMALYRLAGIPTLADDSGLCVDALGGRPGVLSARYGSPDGSATLSSPERNALLLSEMRGCTDRICRFVCCLALVLTPDRVFIVQETCEGVLLDEPQGSGGFGYDPIVFLPALGRSVAELDSAEKNAVSHRGRALARMSAVMDSLGRQA